MEMAMFEFRRGRCLQVFLLSLLLAVSGAGAAEQDEYPSNARVVQRFLQQIYPELANHGYYFGVRGYTSFDSTLNDITHLEAVVTDLPPWKEEPAFTREGTPTVSRPRTLLSVLVLLLRPGDVVTYAAAGDVVHTQENEKLREAVNLHPEWRETQILRALGATRPQYGPADRVKLEATLPIAALRTLLGEITVDSVSFDVFQPNNDTPILGLSWNVTVTARGASERYSLMFEPFGGKLVLLTKLPPSTAR